MTCLAQAKAFTRNSIN